MDTILYEVSQEYVEGDDADMMTGSEEMYPGMEMPQTKTSVMSSWIFVLGITAAVLALGIVLGILLGKKRIKKGFDEYED